MRRKLKIPALILWTAGLAFFAACNLEPVDKSELTDWTDETHGLRSPDYDTVFPEEAVNRLDLVIASADWDEMWDDMTSLYGTFGSGSSGGGSGGGGGQMDTEDNPVYVPCALFFNGRQWYDVGVRFKGNKTLWSAWQAGKNKMAFRLTFDEFEDDYPEITDQRFFGFRELSLSNNFEDSSLIRERVVPGIFRDAGVRAPRTAFYRLYIDHGEGSTYFGLYTAVEVIDDTMLASQFGTNTGNCYKPVDTGATFAADTFSEDDFIKKTNADLQDWSDIIALYDALHASTRTTDPAAWRAGLEAVFNVNGFLNWLAVNTVIQNYDTYGQMSHNYFLYNDPAGPGLTWIPWDNNEALKSASNALSLSLETVTSKWPLIRYLIDDDVYYPIYRADVEQAAAAAFIPETMEATYRRYHALIEPYVTGAEGEWTDYTLLSSTADFDTALDALITHVNQRAQAVAEFLAAASGGSSAGRFKEKS